MVVLACINSESVRFRRRGGLIERRILMPLIRLNEKAFSAGLAGVVFLMTDGSRTVNCWVTYPALQDQTPGLTIAGCIEAFQATRADIEAIASAKFDAGSVEPDGRICISARGPNPHRLFFRITACRCFSSRTVSRSFTNGMMFVMSA